MSNTTTEIAKISVNLLYTLGVIWIISGIAGGFFLKYLYALLNMINKEIEHVKELFTQSFKNDDLRMTDIEKDIEHQRTMHDDHYNFEKEIKPEMSELKADCKNLKENVEKIDTDHRRNHNGRRD